MRRWLALVGCVMVVLATGAGCRPAEGTDGDLTDGWRLPPAPVQFRPAAGTCYDTVAATAGPATYAPIACAERHLAEAFWVGDLSGPAAAASGNEAAGGSRAAAGTGSAARAAAGPACSRQASAFVGADWRTGPFLVRAVLPDTIGWDAGARWFRCDIVQVTPGGQDAVGRTGTLRGALGGAAPLRLRCFDPAVSGHRVTAMTPVPCTRIHHAEFAGLWKPRDATYAVLNDEARSATGCRSAIARYADVPDDGDLPYRVGWIGFDPSRADVESGVRDVQCFLWLDGNAMKGSYRGAGTRKLPVNVG